MIANYFATVLAPYCFGLLSDKVKERAASLSQIRNILPDAIKRGNVNVDDAEKLIHAFCDWAEFDYRVFRKNSSQQERFQTTLKELKWLLTVLSPFILQVKNEVLLKVVELLLNVLLNTPLTIVSEPAVIMNTCLLCKCDILQKLLVLGNLNLVERLLIAVSRQMNNNDTITINECLKLACHVGLIIPSQTMYNSELYKILFDSFLTYLKFSEAHRPDPHLIAFLFATVNALYLSNYDLIALYHNRFSKYALAWFRTRNTCLFQRLVNFYLIERPSADDLSALKSYMVHEISDPLCISLHAGHPVKFLHAFSQYKSGNVEFLNATEILRCTFVDLCCILSLEIDYVPPILAFFEPFRSMTSLKLSTNDPLKSTTFREWSTLAESVRATTSFRPDLLQVETPLVTWYKLSTFSELDYDATDAFLTKYFAGIASYSSLDPFILSQIAKYLSTRFQDLWWTTSAEAMTNRFCSWLSRSFAENSFLMASCVSNLEWLLAFASCLFASVGCSTIVHLQNHTTDSQLFIQTLRPYKSFFDSDASCSKEGALFQEPIRSSVANLLNELVVMLTGSGQDSSALLVLQAIVEKKFHILNGHGKLSDNSILLLCKLICTLPSVVTIIPITDFLSSWIPLIMQLSNEQSTLLEKENSCTLDAFTATNATAMDEITSNTIHMFRFGRRVLSRLEQNLVSCIHSSFRLIPYYLQQADPDAIIIIEDWRVFIDQTLHALSRNTDMNSIEFITNQLLLDLKEFLQIRTPAAFYGITMWTPFAINAALTNLSSKELLEIFDDWILSKKRLQHFPLLEGVKEIELIAVPTIVQVFIQENLDDVFRYLWSREIVASYCHSKFAEIYAFALLLKYSNDPEKQSHGRKVTEEVLPSFIDSEMTTTLIRTVVSDIIAYITVFGYRDWANVIASFKFMAGMLKVSAASDFSELIHPIHAVSIIPIVARRSAQCTPVIKIFQQVPLLKKYPQLLFLASYHLSGEQRDQFNQFADTVSSSWKIIDNSLTDAEFISFSLQEFVLRYCDLVVWRSHPQAASKVLYFMLNIVNRSGEKIHDLNHFEFLDSNIRDRLQLFNVPQNSRIFLPGPRLTENVFEKELTRDLAVTDLINGLLWIVKTSSPATTTEALELLNCWELAQEDSTFARLFLSFLLKAPVVDAVKKTFVQKLSACLQNTPSGLLSRIWFNIIEALPVKQGMASKILHFLPSDSMLLNGLIEDLVKDGEYHSALYLYNVSLEQPRHRSALDLPLLQKIHSGIPELQDDYLHVIKQRLRQFDASIPDPWGTRNEIDKNVELSGLKMVISERLFTERDVSGTLSIKERKFATWLLKLQEGDPGEFECMEEDVGAYVSLLRSVACDQRVVSADSIRHLQCTLLEPSRMNFNVASILPHISPKFESISKYIQADIASKILWGRDPELAIETAKHALNCFPSSLSDELRALLLCRIGEWTGHCKAERPSHIISNYLDKAMRIAEENQTHFGTASLAHIHLIIARFIDEQYGQVTKNEELSRRAQLVSETRAALESCRANLNRLPSSATAEERKVLERNIYELNQQYQTDQEEYTKRLKDRNMFLLKSLSNYIAALSYGCRTETEQISTTSRVCALWFQHHQEATANEIINSSIPGQQSKSRLTSTIKTIPVRNYLPLIYQLAARASYNPSHSSPSDFQKVLLRLLVQLLLAHPFECIYQLLALRSGGYNDTVLSRAKKRRLVESVNVSRDPEAEGRAAAAALVIDQVKRSNPQLAVTISSIEFLCDAYIELAKYSFTESESKTMLQQASPFPSNLVIRKLLHPLPPDSPLKEIPIATCTSETVYFNGFVDRCRVLRGINLPKLVELISTAGSRHQQLVKGNDDVRQDAVMEQVFQRVNQLLRSDNVTRRRGLSMRTYRVIPLRPLVGLIEFVSNSITFSDYLKNAHERLRPSDLKPDECRLKLQTEFDRPGSTVQSKLNVLVNDIGCRFKPVFRHFFFETFRVSDWWSARQAYIRSMATASILGWIVGLGDRHGMNILLDKNTGEVVHIDLNMIFEAGKTLRIPERVPFRLTPDCIDGMGPEHIGLDGPFKQNAIAVLNLLRRERSAVMMILDVFKYDPLQKWTGMAAAAHNQYVDSASPSLTSPSNSNSSSSNFVTSAAERALLRIKEKLEGREEGSILSESGHVSYLIQTATDPEMLCQMFHGWQAYF